MCYFKKAMAAILVLAMSLSLVLCASAATSPNGGTVGQHVVNKTDKTDTVLGSDIQAGYDVSGTGATLIAVNAPKAGTIAVVGSATGTDGKAAPLTQVGSGSYGIAIVKNGVNVTGLEVQSTQAVTTAAKAYKGSAITTVTYKTAGVFFAKNAFASSKVKTINITETNPSKIIAKKGAFGKNGKKVTINVSSKMTKKDLKKLKKALKKQLGATAYKKLKFKVSTTF